MKEHFSHYTVNFHVLIEKIHKRGKT
jgi:hypothetical protein